VISSILVQYSERFLFRLTTSYMERKVKLSVACDRAGYYRTILSLNLNFYGTIGLTAY